MVSDKCKTLHFKEKHSHRAKVGPLKTKKREKTPWPCAAEASESPSLPQYKWRNTCLYDPLMPPYSKDSEKKPM